MTAPAGAPPAISVRGVEKSYGDLAVLKGVDLDIAQGSIVALLGSNGAGKTTLVSILATLLSPDGGAASIGGFDVVADAARVRESISLTGQFAAVDELLTGRENLVLVAKLRHLKGPGAIADSLLDRFSLLEAGGRRVGTYSGGMRRRLDIAMSLIGEPPVVFLDEPTTGLDPEARLEVWDAIREIAARGATVLLTTQYLDEAEHPSTVWWRSWVKSRSWTRLNRTNPAATARPGILAPTKGAMTSGNRVTTSIVNGGTAVRRDGGSVSPVVREFESAAAFRRPAVPPSRPFTPATPPAASPPAGVPPDLPAVRTASCTAAGTRAWAPAPRS
jgi:ABC-2 type transport system ATP-binding protein